MQIMENVYLAISGLRSNKMRALLTMLGIIIGIGSVIGIVTVGNSLTTSVTTEMAGVGVTNIQVMLAEKDDPYADMMMGPGPASGVVVTDNDRVTDEMLDAYRNLYSSDIAAISVTRGVGSGKVEDGRKYANVSVSGVMPDEKIVSNIKLLEGRFINDSDIKSSRSVAVVSDKLVNNMFKKNEDPLGKEVKLSINDNIQTFIVVGIFEHIENSFMFSTGSEKDISTSFYIPISASKPIAVNPKDGYENFTVMAKADKELNKVSDNLEKFFNKYYENNNKFKIMTIKMETFISSITTMLNTISIAIAVIAGISLLVGGIGVMNIMLVSVTERTREIGTRKALGAKNSYILAQFIIEAVIICIIGGIIGIVLGIGIGQLGATLLGYPAAPSIGIIIIAVMFSMFIGVFFGYYPAKKAAQLDPIEALRYE